MVAAFILMRLRLHQLSLVAPILCLAACGSVAVTPDGGGGSTGSAGSGGGSAGSSAGSTGSAGSSAGSTGSAGSSAGSNGSAGSGAGGTGAGGRGGTTGTAGAGGGAGTGGRGGTGGGCVLGGVTYPPGPVPSGDNCNTCACTAGGQIACTARACPPDAGEPGPCILDTTYRYGDTGGHTAYEDQVTLTPPAGYRYARSPRATDPVDLSCAPPLPTCGLANAIDGVDIMRVILDADVQAALSKPADPTMPLIFGRDNRPVDSPIFRFSRGDGREFFVGGPCMTTGSATSCNAIPAGIARLVTELRALDQQQLADPSCAALR